MMDEESKLNDILTESLESTSGSMTPEEFKQWKKEKISIEYLEKEVSVIDTTGFKVVRREWFAKSTCPAITIKYGKIYFNLAAIRKLECEFVLPLVSEDDTKLMIMPGDPNSKESLQWCYTNKKGKLQHRAIGAKKFTKKLYHDKKWPTVCTVKCLGTLLICKGEKAFVFEFEDREMYSMQSVRDEKNDNRRVRREYIQREMWDNYGPSMEEYQAGLVKTLEDVPDDYIVFEKFSNTRRVDAPQVQDEVVTEPIAEDGMDGTTQSNREKESTHEAFVDAVSNVVDEVYIESMDIEKAIDEEAQNGDNN